MARIIPADCAPTSLTCALTVILALVMLPAGTLQAQTFTVIHNFTGGTGGATPYAGVTIDRNGNLYGTTRDGTYGDILGIAYKLTRAGSGWVFNPLHQFRGSPDGLGAEARVVFGPDGALYGTTTSGGANDQGTVFRMSPPPTICRTVSCPWDEAVIYSFGPLPDGSGPGMGDVIFDPAGNLYGATTYGGIASEFCETSCGTVYELSPNGGGWSEQVIYEFPPGVGFFPVSGVIRDGANNLYGTTDESFAGAGVVYELSPSENGQWSENTLYRFGTLSAREPFGGLVMDAAGNLYGSTTTIDNSGGGAAFELIRSANNFSYAQIYAFVTLTGASGGPQAALTLDAAGNLYGTTYGDGANSCGSVFKLTPSNGSWTYTSLHDFTCGSDGGFPISNVTFDAAGNLYGTAALYGGENSGVIWEITP